jgi:uncharacterized protein (DUF433 family)
MKDLFKRITINPGICLGQPCVRGLCYPIEMILGLLKSGMEVDEILRDHEDLEKEDVEACLLCYSNYKTNDIFDNFQIDLSNYQFDRDEANER